MPLSSITSSPNACSDLVQKVQHIGHSWDEHPEWHGRGWYVQLLLSVAGLSRVVEWWEAEKQFWNFDDEDESADNTPGEEEKGLPLTFVLKPSSDHDFGSYSSAASDQATEGQTSKNRDSVDQSEVAQQKTLGLIMMDQSTVNDQPPAEPQNESATQPTEDKLRQEAEKLREEVERAQNMNIVLELSLDGDTVIWVNDAWRTVVG